MVNMYRVTCPDGVNRSPRLFNGRGPAIRWAEFGHCCTASAFHRIEVVAQCDACEAWLPAEEIHSVDESEVCVDRESCLNRFRADLVAVLDGPPDAASLGFIPVEYVTFDPITLCVWSTFGRVARLVGVGASRTCASVLAQSLARGSKVPYIAWHAFIADDLRNCGADVASH